MKYVNKGWKEVIFQLGDWVWLHLKKEPTQKKFKLNSKGDGPFQVVRKINNNAYELELPPSYNMSHTFNVSDLSPFDIDVANVVAFSLRREGWWVHDSS